MSHPQVNATTELIWAICHPDSVLRLRPDPAASEALQVTAAALLALMHLSEIGYTEPVARMVGRLYGLSQVERDQMAIALSRIGADKLLRAIRRYAEMIQFHSSGPALSESEAAALAESKALQWRLLNGVMDAAYELPDKILNWLVAQNLHAERSQRAGMTEQEHDTAAAALPIRVPTDAQIGLFSLQFYWRAGWTQFVNAWLRQHAGHVLAIGPGGRFPVRSWQDCADRVFDPAPPYAFLDQFVLVGLSPDSAGPTEVRFDRQVQTWQFTDIQHSHCQWAITAYKHPERRGLLAFHSTDQHTLARFTAMMTASHVGTLQQFLPNFDHRHSPESDLSFRETSDFGLAALVAAEGDESLPLLGVELYEGSRFWWLEPFEDSDCLLIEAGQSERAPLFRLVVRPRSQAAFLAWWARIGEDVNVTYLAVPGHNAPETALWWLKHGDRDEGLRAWSLELGWVYAHRWGGGSDEHYARFCAEDPACLQRVREFALGMRRKGWYVPIDANER